jgi:hypothetical protein
MNAYTHPRNLAEQPKPAASEQPSELSEVAGRMAMCTEGLHNAISTLESRLGPILKPEFNGDGKGRAEAIPRPVRSPLGEALDRECDAVFNAERRVAALLERLAV